MGSQARPPAQQTLVVEGPPRRRADAGTYKASARDLALLRFVGEQFAVTLPQLARLMGRSEHAARWLRARWQHAGWAEGRVLLVGEPVFVWLTREGQRLANLDYKLWRPNPGALAHVAAVSEVRLYIRARRPDAEWVSERALARTGEAPGAAGAHRPDGVVLTEGRRVAVEVELTQKKRQRSEQIARQLLSRYEAVWYFATPAPRGALSRLAESLGDHRLQVYALPQASKEDRGHDA